MKAKEYKYKINGIQFNVSVGELENNKVDVEVNGTHYLVEMPQEATPKVATVNQPKRPAAAPRTESGEKVIAKPAPAGGASFMVKSPLPGTIMGFKVKVGDTVAAGDTVAVLEAMKMENDVRTTKGGTVKKILVDMGDAVLEGADIMELA